MALLPKCPRGHLGSKVVLDGPYGRAGRPRQRYRCTPAEGTKPHVFVGALPRTRNVSGTCGSCDNPVATHEGPVTAGRSGYLVREVAGALLAVGQGQPYATVARRLRDGAWGAGVGGDRRAATTVESGQTVADWLAAYGPVLVEPFREKAWPETLVADSTRFMYTDSRTGETSQLFCVLAVWGYPAGDSEGRLWALAASPDQDAPAWQRLFASLPGVPSSLVCDRDYGLMSGAKLHWGRKGIAVHLCEHHLYEKGKQALQRGGITEYGHELHVLLNDAFRSPDGWEAFFAAAVAAGGPVGSWAEHWDKRMRLQTARRDQLPPHYANGAVEEPVRRVRQMLERRSWTFRNLERMNLLLGLVRLHLNGVDRLETYTGLIRTHLQAHGGRPAAGWKAIQDPRRTDKRVSVSTLRSRAA